MAKDTVRLIGQDILMRHIKQMSEPRKVFDADFAKNARQSVRELGITTPRKYGHTARGWSFPVKRGDSDYVVSNPVKTPDKKHLLVNILNDGRGEVRPVKAKMLYIPLTNKGRAKAKGAKFGIDFVFAKKAKATRGTKFKDKEKALASRRITRSMIATIRGIHGRNS
jgi:hypothetical protein